MLHGWVEKKNYEKFKNPSARKYFGHRDLPLPITLGSFHLSFTIEHLSFVYLGD